MSLHVAGLFRAHPAPPTPFRAAAECRDTPEVEVRLVPPKAKGPDPFGIRASEDRARRARLGESLSRMQQPPVPIAPPKGQADRRIQGGGVRARRPHRHGSHERSRALGGPGACDDARRFHGDASENRYARIGQPVRTVKSLYSNVKPCDIEIVACGTQQAPVRDHSKRMGMEVTNQSC